MLNKIIQWSIKNRLIVLVGAASCLGTAASWRCARPWTCFLT